MGALDKGLLKEKLESLGWIDISTDDEDDYKMIPRDSLWKNKPEYFSLYDARDLQMYLGSWYKDNQGEKQTEAIEANFEESFKNLSEEINGIYLEIKTTAYDLRCDIKNALNEENSFHATAALYALDYINKILSRFEETNIVWRNP